MLRQSATRTKRWLSKRWLELCVAALTLFVLWQLAGVSAPSQAPPIAPAPGPPQPSQDPTIQFAAPLPGNTAHSVDALVVAGTTVPYSAIGRAISVKAGDSFMVKGWATVGSQSARAVTAVVDSSTAASAPVNGDRPDIANVLKNQRFAKSGFSLVLPTTNLLPGRHSITFRIVTPDGTGYYKSPIHLTLYATSLDGPSAQIEGSIDRLDHFPVKAHRSATPIARFAGTSLNVSGWAIDWAHRTQLKTVGIVVDGKLAALARYGEERPVIAATFQNDAYLHCGYSGTISLVRLHPGMHTISIRGVDIFGGTSDLGTSIKFSR